MAVGPVRFLERQGLSKLIRVDHGGLPVEMSVKHNPVTLLFVGGLGLEADFENLDLAFRERQIHPNGGMTFDPVLVTVLLSRINVVEKGPPNGN